MVLCDANIFIHAFNGNPETLFKLSKIGYEHIMLSAITVMELYEGMGNKKELRVMKENIQYFPIKHIIGTISLKAVELLEKFNLSPGLLIPDAIIATSAIIEQAPLNTYNKKDFVFIQEIELS